MTNDQSLPKRIEYYLKSPEGCPVAKQLLIEQRKHLQAANRGAETNMKALMLCVSRDKEQTDDK